LWRPPLQLVISRVVLQLPAGWCAEVHNRETTQRAMNAAARLATNTRMFDRGLTYMQRHVLHWLDVSDRIKLRLCVTYKCVRGMASDYLSELCRVDQVSALHGRRHLRSAGRGHLEFPRVRRATYGERWFAYAGPSALNSLPHLIDTSFRLSVFRSEVSPVC